MGRRQHGLRSSPGRWSSADAPAGSTTSLSRGQATGGQWPPLTAWVVEEGAQQGLSVTATKQHQTARLRGTVGVLECSDASSGASGGTSEEEKEGTIIAE